MCISQIQNWVHNLYSILLLVLMYIHLKGTKAWHMHSPSGLEPITAGKYLLWNPGLCVPSCSVNWGSVWPRGKETKRRSTTNSSSSKVKSLVCSSVSVTRLVVRKPSARLSAGLRGKYDAIFHLNHVTFTIKYWKNVVKICFSTHRHEIPSEPLAVATLSLLFFLVSQFWNGDSGHHLRFSVFTLTDFQTELHPSGASHLPDHVPFNHR